jgi:hypothetical protein
MTNKGFGVASLFSTDTGRKVYVISCIPGIMRACSVICLETDIRITLLFSLLNFRRHSVNDILTLMSDRLHFGHSVHSKSY